MFKDQVARLLNNPELAGYIPYLAVFIVLTLVTNVLETLMVAIKQANLAAWTFFGSELSRGALMIGAALLTRSMMMLIAATLVWSVFRFITLMVYLRYLNVPLWMVPDHTQLAEQFKYAIPFGVALVVRTGADALPQYVVSYLYDPALFAVYSIGYLQIPVVSIMFESIAEVTLVKLTEFRSAGTLDKALHVLGGSVNKLCLFLFPLCGWLMVNARDIIVLLFTERFESSVELFRIFLTTIPLTALALDYVPRAFADMGFVLRVNVVRVVLTAVLLLILVPYLGMTGAALATVLAIGVTKVLILLRVKALFNSSLKGVLPWNRIAKTAVTSVIAGACAVAGQLLPIPYVGLRLFFSGLVFILVYGLLLWIGGVIEPEEKQKVIGWLQGVALFQRNRI